MSVQTLTRREKQQRTRTALLKAAVKLFRERGLEGASIDEVAQAAGYTKGAFYANFKSKEELFLVMLDERFASQLDRLDKALSGTHEAQEEARAAAVECIHFAGDEDWPNLYFQFVAHAARNEEFRQELATRHQAMRARLAEILERWKRSTGHKPPLPMEQITAMLSFMADGFLVDRIVEPDLSEDLYATMMTVFLCGLKAMAVEQENALERDGSG
jgi:AcrR family transcriptional regulator